MSDTSRARSTGPSCSTLTTVLSSRMRTGLSPRSSSRSRSREATTSSIERPGTAFGSESPNEKTRDRGVAVGKVHVGVARSRRARRSRGRALRRARRGAARAASARARARRSRETPSPRRRARERRRYRCRKDPWASSSGRGRHRGRPSRSRRGSPGSSRARASSSSRRRRGPEDNLPCPRRVRARSVLTRSEQRRRGEELADGKLPVAGNQTVSAEGLAIEENTVAESELLVEIGDLRHGFVVARSIDAELPQQAPRLRSSTGPAPPRSRSRRSSGTSSRSCQNSFLFACPPKSSWLSSTRMLRPLAVKLSEEVRRGESADSAADDHQVVGLVDRFRVVPGLSVAHLVRDLERPRVASAHAGARGRVVVVLASLKGSERAHGRSGKNRRSESDRDAVQKVPAADRPVHPEVAVASSSTWREYGRSRGRDSSSGRGLASSA